MALPENSIRASEDTYYTYQSGTEGTQGGNAGRGGKGGKGGHQGGIALKVNGVLRNAFNVHGNSSIGLDGPDGDHGSFGIGGQNGPIYKGKFLHKKIKIEELKDKTLNQGALPAGGAVAIGATTTLGLTAGGVAIAYASLPLVTTVGDVLLNGGWIEKPYRVQLPQRAVNGTQAQLHNVEGLQEPRIIPTIDPQEIGNTWRAMVTGTAL